MRQSRRAVAIVVLPVVSACGGNNTDADAIVARAERITVDLAALIDESPGIAGTVRYGCSADPALQVAQTNLDLGTPALA